MTVKIVPFNTNLTSNNADVAQQLRWHADNVEAGDYGEVDSLVLSIGTQEGMRVKVAGKDLTLMQQFGILEMSKLALWERTE